MAARTHQLWSRLSSVQGSRLLAKTMTWRAIGIATLFTLSFALTGSPIASGTLALTYHLVSTLLYYLHERAWEGQGPSPRALMASVVLFAALTLALAWLASLAP